MRPAYQVLRQNEDWSALRAMSAEAVSDPFDGIKYAALSSSGRIWASFGGQLRLRAENWVDFNFGALPAGVENDDLFLLGRALLHADFHFGPSARLFVQGKSALLTDRDLAGGKRAIDEDRLDLQNAFLELGTAAGSSGRLWLRVGRQELLFGKQRLVSPLDWTNTRRTFDGGSAGWKSGPWSATLFAVSPVVVDAGSFNDADDSVELAGLYTSWSPKPQMTVELYALSVDRDEATVAAVTGRSRRETYGARFEAAAGNVDVELEGAWQSGHVGTSDVDAFMVSAVLGFAEKQHRLAPRIAFGFDFASGDERANDGRLETFDQLFPLSHAFLGYMDFVGRQNVMDFSGRFESKVGSRTSLQLDLHSFFLASAADGLYGANGALARAPNRGGSKAVGQEVDLVFKHTTGRHLLYELGLGRFFADDYLAETGPSDDVSFAYLTTQLTF